MSDTEWRALPDPEYSCWWRCRNLVFEYRFVESWWVREKTPPDAGWVQPTAERVAIWEDLFLRPAHG